MNSATERRFAAAQPEKSRVAERVIAEVLLTRAPLLYILMNAFRINGLPEVPAWAYLAVLAWLLALVRDRTADIVIRADEVVDQSDSNRHPFGRMTSPPELTDDWLYGPRISFEQRLVGTVLFGKDTRRTAIQVGQLPEATRQELLAYLTEAFERRKLGVPEESSMATTQELPTSES